MAVFEYRLARSDMFGHARRQLREDRHEIDEIVLVVGRHSEQISGEGGLQNAVRVVREEISGLRRAFYALTGSIVVGTVALLGAVISHAL